MEGSRLNGKKFSGLIIRKTKPKGTIILFRSGKFIIVGAENAHNCELLSKKLPKDLHKVLSISDISTKTFRVSNMIANGNIGYAVNIPRIA
jgi:TATA-box binding protein (TBP) (component of TFIID and TFIIIB)